MTDNIRPDHYRTGEIDLYEAFSQIFPHNEYRAGMQMIAMRYMFRDKIDRVEDISKAIYTLERLKEKEIEYKEKLENEKIVKNPEETFDDMREAFAKMGKDFSETFYKYDCPEPIPFLEDLTCRGFKYITRDGDNVLYAYQFPPIKGKSQWIVGENDDIDDVVMLGRHSFPEVQWTDDEPTKIANLLATYENGGENGRVEVE